MHQLLVSFSRLDFRILTKSKCLYIVSSEKLDSLSYISFLRLNQNVSQCWWAHIFSFVSIYF